MTDHTGSSYKGYIGIDHPGEESSNAAKEGFTPLFKLLWRLILSGVHQTFFYVRLPGSPFGVHILHILSHIF